MIKLMHNYRFCNRNEDKNNMIFNAQSLVNANLRIFTNPGADVSFKTMIHEGSALIVTIDKIENFMSIVF